MESDHSQVYDEKQDPYEDFGTGEVEIPRMKNSIERALLHGRRSGYEGKCTKHSAFTFSERLSTDI